MNGGTYWYLVRAVDNAGNESLDSTHRSASPFDSDAPAPPHGLRGHGGCPTADKISLQWDASPESDLNSYILYRSLSPNLQAAVEIAVPELPVFPVVDTPSDPPSKTYYYAVAAKDDAGHISLKSEVIALRTRAVIGGNPIPTTPTAVPGMGRAKVKWQGVSGSHTYSVYRRPLDASCADFEPVQTALLTPTSGTEYEIDDFSVANSHAYDYVISALQSDQESPDSVVISEVVPLERPTGVRACYMPGDSDDPLIRRIIEWPDVSQRQYYDEAAAAAYGKGYVGFVGYTALPIEKSYIMPTNWNTPWVLPFTYPSYRNRETLQQIFLYRRMRFRAVYKINDFKFCDSLPGVEAVACKVIGSHGLTVYPQVNPAYHPSYIFSEPSEWWVTPPQFYSVVENDPVCSSLWIGRPSNVRSSRTANGDILVQWDLPPGNASSLSAFRVTMDERETVVLAPNITSYLKPFSSACRMPSFRVEALDNIGFASDDTTYWKYWTTAPFLGGTVAGPSSMALEAGPAASQLTFKWKAPTENLCFPTRYVIGRTGGAGNASWTFLNTGGPPAQYKSMTNTFNAGDTSTYSYKIHATYAQRELNGFIVPEYSSPDVPIPPLSSQPPVSVTLVLPVPTNLQSSAADPAISPGTVTLTWRNVALLDAPSSPVDGYRIYYWNDNDPGHHLIWNPSSPVPKGAGSTTSQILSGLVPGRAYTFAVTSVHQTGTLEGLPVYDESAWSAPNETSLPSAEVLRPPTQLGGSPGPYEGQISLHWTAPPSPAVTPAGYIAYDITTSPALRLESVVGSDYTAIISGTSAYFSNLQLGMKRRFAVTSVDSEGNESALSTPVEMFPYDAAPENVFPHCIYCGTGNQTVYLQWSSNTGDGETDHYYITRTVANTNCTNDPNRWNHDFENVPRNQSVLVDTLVAPGCTYVYAIVAIDQEGNISLQPGTASVVNGSTCRMSCAPELGDGDGHVWGNTCNQNCGSGSFRIPRIVDNWSPGAEVGGDRIAQLDAESYLSGNDTSCSSQPGTQASVTVKAAPMVNMLPYRIIGTPQPGDQGGGNGGGGNYVPPSYQWRFFHADHLGTPRIITSSAGLVVSEHHYLPFGEEVPPSDHNGVGNSSNNSHRFTGHERDASTGLDYMLARYYEAGLVRFMSPDPSSESFKPINPQTWNRYSYVANNPVLFHDPTGMDLVLSGKSKDLLKVKQIADKNLFGKEAKIDDKGEVTLQSNGQVGPRTPQQTAFENTLSQAINNPETTSIKVVKNSTQTLIDSYEAGEIDIADVLAYKNGPGASSAGMLAHAVAEQFAKQVEHKGIGGADGAHYGAGFSAENGATGYLRGPAFPPLEADANTGRVNGITTVPYTRGNTTVRVTTTVQNSNVTSVGRN